MGRGNRKTKSQRSQVYIDPREAFRGSAKSQFIEIPEYNCEICMDEGWTTEADADMNPDGSLGDPYPVQVACVCEAGREFLEERADSGSVDTDDIPF